MDPDEVLLALHSGRQTGDRQRGGIGPQHRIGLNDVLDLTENLVLEFLALEDGLDDEVHAGEVLGVGGRGDPAQQRRGFLGRGLAALERLGLDLLRVGLALVGSLDRDIFEHHVESRLGRDVGDARAHHPGAEHADLGDRGLTDTLGARTTGIDGLHVEEERLNHVLRDGAGD